jgi:hypothetical protein
MKGFLWIMWNHFIFQICFINQNQGLGMVAYACNPIYVRGSDQEDGTLIQRFSHWTQ